MKANPVRICVPICELTCESALAAIAKASNLGDLLELRLDCLEVPDLKPALARIAELARGRGKPLVLTYRPAEQGGRRNINQHRRQEFWSSDELVAGDFFDLELDIVEQLSNFPGMPAAFDWASVICSHHDFAGLPPDLDQIYKRMSRTPARILKIAVKVNDVTDCLPVFRLLERANSEQRELIAIAMGPEGIATRILGPSRGSFLTYGALEDESATAPGQVTARELRTLYRIEKINPQTQILGLAGWPVAHSISPQIHNRAFDRTGFDGIYIPFAVRDIATFVKRMVHPQTREIDWNMRGLSVTAPHKSAVMECLDWIDPAAQEIGAVNTVVVDREELRGHNTDAEAFMTTLTSLTGDLREARCAVIGAGGAACAALWSLREQHADVTVCARDALKARSLGERFGARSERLGLASFDGFDVVINATTLGTSGRQEMETPATADQLRGTRFVYDLVYNPAETRFMAEARRAGCQVLGGLAMLVAQAAEQFRLWTGGEAPREEMQGVAVRALSREVSTTMR